MKKSKNQDFMHSFQRWSLEKNKKSSRNMKVIIFRKKLGALWQSLRLQVMIQLEHSWLVKRENPLLAPWQAHSFQPLKEVRLLLLLAYMRLCLYVFVRAKSCSSHKVKWDWLWRWRFLEKGWRRKGRRRWRHNLWEERV